MPVLETGAMMAWGCKSLHPDQRKRYIMKRTELYIIQKVDKKEYGVRYIARSENFPCLLVGGNTKFFVRYNLRGALQVALDMKVKLRKSKNKHGDLINL